eukprot:COSAG02_NODE_46160_length_351_cov_0.821429_1_plen_112_part_10
MTSDSTEGPVAIAISLVDMAGNAWVGDFMAIVQDSLLPIDATTPIVVLASIASDGSNASLAATGSVVSLHMHCSETVHEPRVQLAGRDAHVECVRSECTAMIVVLPSDPAGV